MGLLAGDMSVSGRVHPRFFPHMLNPRFGSDVFFFQAANVCVYSGVWWMNFDVSGQITIIPKPEFRAILGGFPYLGWGRYKLPRRFVHSESKYQGTITYHHIPPLEKENHRLKNAIWGAMWSFPFPGGYFQCVQIHVFLIHHFGVSSYTEDKPFSKVVHVLFFSRVPC